MPSKKKKYNARFPAGRIKKIMQSDEEVGKVAQAVPVIISRTLELFVESLLTKTLRVTNARNAKTLSPSHMKQCIMSENRFDFLRELVKNIPDISYDDNDGSLTPNIDATNNFFHHNPQEIQNEPFDLRINAPSQNNLNQQNNFQMNTIHNGNNLRNENTQRGYSRELKRPWESSSTSSSVASGSSTITSQEQKMLYSPSTSSTIFNEQKCSPPKLQRTNSVMDEKSNSRMQPFLQHQPKSLPGLSSSSSSFEHPIVPAPIIIDLNPKPTIKIDYTNLMQQQELEESRKKLSTTDNTTISQPVINIDLSKMATEPPTINVNLNLTTTEKQLKQKQEQKENNLSTLFKPAPTLELDEDYDNI